MDRLRRVLGSNVRRNAAWFTALSAGERFVALAQTILVSRALGIAEYGVYGLLFGSIGFVASAVGLQMGLTATVFVSKYRVLQNEKAAAVISIVNRFGWIVAGGVVLLVAPFLESISLWLLQSSDYSTALLFGIALICVSIVSGIQDGIAQGLEMFPEIARIKLTVSLGTLLLIYPAALWLKLDGVLAVVLVGMLSKLLALRVMVSRAKREMGIPTVGFGVSFRDLTVHFAFPSMMVSFGVGLVTWLGMFLLSREDLGFEGVAIANAGLQWRGPVLLLTASLASVMVPVFSRLHGAGERHGARRLRSSLAIVNFGIALVCAVATLACSPFILRAYGDEFSDGTVVFSVLVLTAVPTVLANAYMQELLGAARMWRQLWLHVPYLTVMVIGFLALVPRYQAMGYAVSLLLASAVFAMHVIFADIVEWKRRPAEGKDKCHTNGTRINVQ